MTTCPICKRKLKQLHGSHLKQHNITSEKFKAMYPDVSFENNTSKTIRNNDKRLRELKYLSNPLKCKQCEAPIPYQKAIDKKASVNKQKTKNIFCSSSCAATYNNTHKTQGCRKSKLEYYLEEKLPALYPSLEFHFNRKDAINSELDIYIPSLKLAFELNGIYHYEPIHGAVTLTKIQNNDHRKFQACLERNIELCIIDSSKLAYFKESNAKPYLEIVQKILDQKISPVPGLNR
jgi:hypothetical protein